jgi:hypothetical protein
MRRPRNYTTRHDVAPHGVWGPSANALAQASAVDWAYGRGLAGHAGAARIGMASYGVGRFSGDCGPLQAFARFPAGATTSTFRALNMEYALPNTGPIANINPVLGTMVRNSLGASLQ